MNARSRLKLHAQRHLVGRRLEDEYSFISTLEDDDCERYLKAIHSSPPAYFIGSVLHSWPRHHSSLDSFHMAVANRMRSHGLNFLQSKII